MKKLIMGLMALAFTFTLTGCVATTAVKYTTDTVCDSTDKEKLVLKQEFDKATKPHKVRVICNATD